MAFEVVPAALEGYNLTSIVYNHNTNTRKLKIYLDLVLEVQYSTIAISYWYPYLLL